MSKTSNFSTCVKLYVQKNGNFCACVKIDAEIFPIGVHNAKAEEYPTPVEKLEGARVA